MKILIFIVAYNAERHIESVLQRIPDSVWNNKRNQCEVLIIDDQSGDQTTIVSQRFRNKHPHLNLIVLSNPVNQGYGGNQKLGYAFAIKRGFDIVILLHGDGQYAPELLPEFIDRFDDPAVDAVFGSRMLSKRSALRGGMPIYKFVGNRILTGLQNLLLRQRLSEFHSGYRSYRVSSLAAVPFESNSSDFDFDTDIIIQFVAAQHRIVEIPIPTYYGTEICRVNGVKYAFQILSSTVRYTLQRYSIFYHPKYDLAKQNEYYTLKLGQPSSHEWALLASRDAQTVLDLGCGPGLLSRELRRRNTFVMGIDKYPQSVDAFDWFRSEDLDEPLTSFSDLPRAPQKVLCLDIIEHLKSPEQFLRNLRICLNTLSAMPEVVLSTPNIAFATIRLGLFLGIFNYGKKGILDLTHTRLFTFKSFCVLLRNAGYVALQVRGIPPPVQMVFGSHFFGRGLSKAASILAAIWPRLFAYQIFVVARPLPTAERLLKESHEHARRIEIASTGIATELQEHRASAQ